MQLLSLIVKKLTSPINTCSITIILSEGQVLLSVVIVFSIYFSLSAEHTHSHYATLHQQRIGKKAQKAKQDAYKHREMLSFSALSILMWPNICMYGLKKTPKPQKTLQNSLLIFIGKYIFSPQKKIKFQYCLQDGCSNLKSKQVHDVRSQAFIWLCAILLSAVTGTGEITDVLASHRQSNTQNSKKIPRITTAKHYPPAHAFLCKRQEQEHSFKT